MLIQIWASQKSYHSKDGSDDGDGANFRGQMCSSDTHQSTSHPAPRVYKKSYGKESKLSYLGHAREENRNGVIADAMVTQAAGCAERNDPFLMLDRKQKGRAQRITAGVDKAYDTRDFVAAASTICVTTHVTKNDNGRCSTLDL